MSNSKPKTIFLSAALFSLIFLAFAAHAQQQDSNGFKPMFNGKNFEGWQTKGNWKILKNGVIHLQPRPGEKGWERYGSYLWTNKKYGDFILDLEYKHPKGGNSGIFVRTKNRAKNCPDVGIEVQILDSHGKKGKLIHHDCGGVIRTSPPSKNMAKPAGQWNRMIITCKGNTMKVKLNGEQIINLDLSKTPMKDRPMQGYIGIQDHGLPFYVRNVKIKVLK